MNIEQITSEALHLDPKSRAVLAEAIWESLEDPFLSSGEISDQAALQLAKDRAWEMEKGEVEPLSHDEMMSRLRS